VKEGKEEDGVVFQPICEDQRKVLLRSSGVLAWACLDPSDFSHSGIRFNLPVFLRLRWKGSFQRSSLKNIQTTGFKTKI
jgi:hypothetical protein